MINLTAIAECPVRWLVGLLALVPAATLSAATPAPYEAVYEVFIKDKLSMETRIVFSITGDRWRLESDTEGVKGLASFLRVSSREVGTGTWQEDRFIPETFLHAARAAGQDRGWSADFDWQSGQVMTRHEEGESVLPLIADTWDPVSLGLVLRQRLQAGDGDWEMFVVDEDEIDAHRYQPTESEPLQTRLGCLEVVRVDRIREKKTRYSSGWYARDLDFIPVRLQHGKQGGREFNMHIRELVYDGQPMAAFSDCPDTD